MIRSVTVFCSSSNQIDHVYLDGGRELGSSIAKAGWTLVYGGNNVGLMGIVANSARAKGGKVIGVTPQLFVDKGVADQACVELLICDNLRQRKALMEQRGDAFVVLPGGIGTLEEFFEILVGRQLGYHNKAIVLLNLNGFFDPLVDMLRRGIDQRFVRPRSLEIFHVAAGVSDAIEFLKRYEPAAPSSDLSFETSRQG